LSRSSFQTCSISAWSIHSRLPRTSTSGLHRTRVVRKVRTLPPLLLSLKINPRCTVPLGKPQGEGVRRCQEHTLALVEELELGVLWDEYGLVGDVVVGGLLLVSLLSFSVFLVFRFSFIAQPHAVGVLADLLIDSHSTGHLDIMAHLPFSSAMC
jgi:hypothetical protein